MAVRHIPPESHGSTFYVADDARFGAGMVSQTPQLDNSFLRQPKDFDLRARQTGRDQVDEVGLEG